MCDGIAVIGLNGSGKSTLNHLLCQTLGYFEMDVEDYYFPHQRAGRLRLLDGVQAGGPEEQPYARECSQEQVQAALLKDMEEHPRFVLSCVKLGWSEELLRKIDVVLWVRVPAEERLKRIVQREERRFGTRVLPGGDLYDRQRAFREMAMRRDDAQVEATLAAMDCPVIPLDGTKPEEELLAEVRRYLQK